MSIEQRVAELERLVVSLQRDLETSRIHTLAEVKREIVDALKGFSTHVDATQASFAADLAVIREHVANAQSVTALAARMTEILELLAGTRLALDKRNAFDELAAAEEKRKAAIAAQQEVAAAAQHRTAELRLKKWGPVIGIVGTLLGLAASAILSHFLK